MNKEQIKRAKAIADEYANTQGKKDINDVIKPIKDGLNSDSDVLKSVALQDARKTVEQLTKLVLRQELFKNPTPDYMDKIIDAFYDGEVKEGNAKTYDYYNATGVSSYNPNEFVPSALTTQNVDEYIIQMYSGTGSLSTQGYQFRKTQVLVESKWIPYFKSGKLIEFIANIESSLYFAWKCYIFDKIMTKISATNGTDGLGKVITGSGADAFECWSKEILPTIREMTTLSKTFNRTQAQTNLEMTNPDDLIIIAHPKTIQTLESGIKSQLFNAKFLDLKGILSDNNLYNPGKKLTISDENTVIANQESYYVDENTLIVISKKAFKHFTQIERLETQFYGRNMSTELVLHKWGALDFLPWGQGFVYKNTNLNKLP